SPITARRMRRSNEVNERRSGGLIASLRHLTAVDLPRYVFAVALLCGVLLDVPSALSQRRPVLRNARRDLAGSLVLLPASARLHSLTLPKQMAAIADHELITPPPSVLSDAEQLRRWASDFDFAETDGVILSLDIWPDGQTQPAVTALLKDARASRPNLPV